MGGPNGPQGDSLMHPTGYGGDHIGVSNTLDFYAPVHEDTSVEARAKIQDL